MPGRPGLAELDIGPFLVEQVEPADYGLSPLDIQRICGSPFSFIVLRMPQAGLPKHRHLQVTP